MHALKRNRPLRRVMLASAATVSVMVLLPALKPHTAPATGSVAPAPSASAGATGGSGSGGTGTRTVTGDTVPTRWGPVQVRVTVEGGRITDVTAVRYPTGNPRDREIAGYALPELRREALAAQSARSGTVSGATYTSQGYQRSLRSALDSAGV
ncbi:FMN-binding protein [Streptomyces gramineus]|uniref:FMN-binding protein n=1 Tax=Streptomyces gramineus TaxID=910542 RepID=UPI00398B326F